MSLKPVMYEKNHSLFRWLTERRMKYSFKAISNLKPRYVLDIGCGDGTLLSKISADQKVGIDLDVTYRKRVKKAGIMFIRADAEHLPFKNEVFDLVLATEILEHLNDYHACLTQIQKQLKTGGYLLVSVPNDHLFILGKLILLRFKSIKVTLRGHKHHNMVRELCSFLGKPIVYYSTTFHNVLAWKLI